MASAALGWMIGAGIVLAFTLPNPLTGIFLVIMGIAGFVDLMTGWRRK